MKPNEVKEVLFSSIEKISKEPYNYCFKPDVDFSRRRKLSLDVMLKQIIKMGSYSLQNEMIDIFQNLSVSVSSSAFVQQRQKIKISAFENILSNFNKEISSKFSNKLRIIAIDGSDIHIPTNPNDKDSFFKIKRGRNLIIYCILMHYTI